MALPNTPTYIAVTMAGGGHPGLRQTAATTHHHFTVLKGIVANYFTQLKSLEDPESGTLRKLCTELITTGGDGIQRQNESPPCPRRRTDISFLEGDGGGNLTITHNPSVAI